MKDIKGYEGLYAVTSCGKVFSYRNKKFLKPRKTKGGYLLVSLFKDGKMKNFYVHRLVAQEYIPNPDNLPQVNHKDEVKSHNWVNNLEYCTARYNRTYGKRTPKRIKCVETGKVFESIIQCAREMGLWSGSIWQVLNSRLKKTGGYTFEYVKEET